MTGRWFNCGIVLALFISIVMTLLVGDLAVPSLPPSQSAQRTLEQVAEERPVRPRKRSPADSVDFYSDIAEIFDAKYNGKPRPRYIERYHWWTEVIAKYSSPDGHVLDVGCGSGVLSFFASGLNRSVIGLDPSKEMIAICEKKKNQMNPTNISFINGNIDDLSSLSFPPIDLILCSSVLEYLDDLPGVLALLVSLLSQNGILIFSLPNKSSLYRKLEPYIFRVIGWPRYYRYVRQVITLDRAGAMVKDLGLNVLETAYHGRTPLLSRICRLLGFPKYSDNLFIVVAQKP